MILGAKGGGAGGADGALTTEYGAGVLMGVLATDGGAEGPIGILSIHASILLLGAASNPASA